MADRSTDKCCANCEYYEVADIKKGQRIKCNKGHYDFKEYSVARVPTDDKRIPSITNFETEMECYGKDFSLR